MKRLIAVTASFAVVALVAGTVLAFGTGGTPRIDPALATFSFASAH